MIPEKKSGAKAISLVLNSKSESLMAKGTLVDKANWFLLSVTLIVDWALEREQKEREREQEKKTSN